MGLALTGPVVSICLAVLCLQLNYLPWRLLIHAFLQTSAT